MSLRNDPDKFYKVGKIYEFKAGGTDTRKARKYIRKHKLKATEIVSKSLVGVCVANSMEKWGSILDEEVLHRVVKFKIIMSTENDYKIGQEYVLRRLTFGSRGIMGEFTPFKTKGKEI